MYLPPDYPRHPPEPLAQNQLPPKNHINEKYAKCYNLRLIQVIKIWKGCLEQEAIFSSPHHQPTMTPSGSTLQGIKLRFLGEKTGLGATTEYTFKHYTTYLIFTSLPHATRKMHNPSQDSPAHRGSQFNLKCKINILKPLLNSQGEESSFLFQ